MHRMIVLAVSILTATPCLAGDDLVGPVYPGAVRDGRYCLMMGDDDCPEVYYTKDPMDKVIAFYKSRSINMDMPAYKLPVEFRAGGDAGKVAVIYSGAEVYRMLDLKGELGVRSAVISVEQRNRPGPGCPEKPFDEGRRIMAAAQGLTKARFDEACRKYGHLQWALYRYSEEKGSNGLFIKEDKAVWKSENDALGRAIAGAAGGSDPYKSKIKRIERKIKRKQRRGDNAAVAELAKELDSLKAEQAKWASSSGSAAPDPIGSALWENFIENLKRLDEKAYNTAILIDRHPRNWKLGQ